MKSIKPKFYIIPGWGGKIHSRSYQSLIRSVKGRYVVVPVELSLTDKQYLFGKNRQFSEILKKAKQQIKKGSSKDAIFGFSIGALIAYKLATKIKFKQVIICSISPILDEDLSLYPPKEVVKIFTPEQVKELNKIKYGKPKGKTAIFYGTLESKECIERSKRLPSDIVTPIKNTKHSLTSNYLKAVKQLIK